MAKINAANERIKRDYLRFLKEAKGKSEATLDMVRKALARFEESTGAKDFKTSAANRPPPSRNASARRRRSAPARH